jgi:hypothetical protein
MDCNAINILPFMGLTETEAKKLALKDNFEFRVIRRDKQSYPTTLEFRYDRLNFEIENDKVVYVDRG